MTRPQANTTDGLRFAPDVAYNGLHPNYQRSYPVSKSKEPNVDENDFAKFEDYLTELEQLVERMEKGDQTLDQSLKDFERGVELTKACEKTLNQAEQRVEQLVKKHGELKLEPFSPED